MKAWLSGCLLFLGVCLQLPAQTCPGSLFFNATNPAVNLPSSNQYYTGANGGYTWECWFMLTQPFGANVRPLISSIDGVTFEDQYLGFGWQGGWYNEPVTKLVFKVDGPNMAFPTGPNCSYAPPGGFLLNTWYHAAGVMSYSTQLATLYVNGVAVDTKIITTPPITRVIPTELSFNWGGTPLPLGGHMDEVRIWTRPLSAVEVLANYNQCLNGNEQNLFVYYRCNQPGGVTVPDATANNNTGTFSLAQGWSNLDAPVTGTACATLSSTLGITSSGSIICAGQTATLAVFGAASYTWSNGANTSSIAVSPNITTSYTVWGSVNSCSAITTTSVVMTVTVNPLINVLALASQPVLCSGATTTLWAFGAVNYTWSTGPQTNSIVVSPLTTTTYSVFGAPCTNTANPGVVTVTVVPVPVVTAAPPNTSVCSGMSATFSASGANTYTWSNGVINSSITVNPPATSSYTVVGAVGSCTAQATVTAVILPNPVPSVTGASVCIGQTATLTASGGTTYHWIGPGGFSSGNQNPAILVNTGSMGVYTVIVSVGSCTASATTLITGNPFALPTVSITGKPRACLYSDIKLEGSGGVTYTWTGPNNYFSTQPTIQLSATGFSVGGVYILSVKNNSNCIASGSVQVTVYPPPTGSLVSSNNKGCVPFCSTFSLLPSAANAAPVNSSAFLVAGYPVSGYCFTKAGDYEAAVFFTDTNGCSNTASLTVSAYPVPVADFYFLPAAPIEGMEPVIFTNTSQGASMVKWNWYFTNNAGGTSHSETSTSYVYENAGTYPVVLVVGNAWGCADTAIKVITVTGDFSFYIPNAFTPNGNGLNDVFQPKGLNVVNYDMEIFDRWGEKLFSSTEFAKGWDGTYKGELCKNDTYVWKIKLKDPSGKTKHYMGHVSIVN